MDSRSHVVWYSTCTAPVQYLVQYLYSTVQFGTVRVRSLMSVKFVEFGVFRCVFSQSEPTKTLDGYHGTS